MLRRLQRTRSSLFISTCLTLPLCFGLAACSGGSTSAEDDSGWGEDGDSGSASAGGTSDGGSLPPDDEEEADFRTPRASGRFVFSASSTTDRVAVIDTESLVVDVIDVPREPTALATMPDGSSAARVAVLSVGTDEVSVLDVDDEGGIALALHAASPGVNALAASPNGPHLVVYHDVDAEEPLGPGSDQELTVIDADGPAIYEMTVGLHPREVEVAPDGQRAFVVNDDGVNVITFADLGEVGKPPLVPVVTEPGINPDTVEVQLAAAQTRALSRVDGQSSVVVTDLLDGNQSILALPGEATDVDVAADIGMGIVVVPDPAGSRLLEVDLNADPATGTLIEVLGGEYVTLAEVAENGETMVLYSRTEIPVGDGDGDGGDGDGTGVGDGDGDGTGGTGGDGDGDGDGDMGDGDTGDGDSGGMEPDPGPDPDAPDPRSRVTILRRESGVWTPYVFFTEQFVRSVGISPDGQSAVLLHEAPGAGQNWSYTLVDMVADQPIKKVQNIPAEATTVLFDENGDWAVLLVRDAAGDVMRADHINLRTFIVQGIDLASPPVGGGSVAETQKFFISQEHPTGRISFIATDGSVETLTGFELNDAVKD